MSVEDSGKVPLVSGQVFTDLQADLADVEIARRYLSDYLVMWDDRFLRLSAAINVGNSEAAMDAVLSVRTSARMIGALRLAKLAAGIEQQLAAGDTRGAASVLEDLEVCGRVTMEELRRRFLPRSGPAAPGGGQPDYQILGPGTKIDGWLRRADSLIAGLASSAKWKPRPN